MKLVAELCVVAFFCCRQKNFTPFPPIFRGVLIGRGKEFLGYFLNSGDLVEKCSESSASCTNI